MTGGANGVSELQVNPPRGVVATVEPMLFDPAVDMFNEFTDESLRAVAAVVVLNNSDVIPEATLAESASVGGENVVPE